MSLVVRTQGDPTSVVPAILGAIWSVDEDQPIVRVTTMPELVTSSQAERRFAMIIVESFALIVLPTLKNRRKLDSSTATCRA